VHWANALIASRAPSWRSRVRLPQGTGRRANRALGDRAHCESRLVRLTTRSTCSPPAATRWSPIRSPVSSPPGQAARRHLRHRHTDGLGTHQPPGRRLVTPQPGPDSPAGPDPRPQFDPAASSPATATCTRCPEGRGTAGPRWPPRSPWPW